MMARAPFDDWPHRRPLLTALALSLGAAVALGIARFAYGLLLPPMRADLGWSYFLAGAMNTANAFGYLLGALVTPWLLRRVSPQRLLVAGAMLTGLFMLVSGMVTATGVLLSQRILAGVSSAFVFIAGGILAARLGALHSGRSGLLLGLYYGGTGIGIAASALLVPASLAQAASHGAAHGWQWPWLVLGGVCLLATALMAAPLRAIPEAPQQAGVQRPFQLRAFAFGLLGYFMFGVGYIGYMTFVVALLRQQGMAAPLITVFYALLGLAVVASSRIWAGMLDRFKGGESLAILNALLGIATILPALSAAAPLVFLSGLLFGAVFLSVVASTTALVRHNLPPQSWSAGISAFTTVFAFGQIVGPSTVGWIADRAGGLEQGLVFSALALFAGAILSMRQRSLLKN
ncbi:YbfB/YjiJ family MFS transporter [Noviherbaspirillum sedimenti]|uniref:YbfB/YjiJ family MFS transporter n=1 Tax=Noviherbaspirillum sedimenti TaxID=2320865 RepID=A0A3A3GDC0_9BURK|nr:YbfB/YjiJ family MFS transporter [Noviherbaspirillum sedimenti]RJG00226.1 YbfB/YjiJ family MFS transporter [Noviherbaspirillum sedimenti]